ncbi:polyphosphate kinase 1 [Paracrocinitomix mangrovi]|uniref:polyphosphate kinase 1 n=1 Tax=Paracrocinitomix mangrovi TaxID=2862509 RepID=UPI001C8DFAB4|nr:polyphosphate kinase 1 [Paracrocinitomix mangrovi]UKN01102.1 polyphosphate kinase 1 [Paracrocinitomix mangrovi]
MELYNRELSWLSFNERVLQESLDENNPLIERIRFLGIYSNNLDEFFRVRVATLRRMDALGTKKVEGFKGGPRKLLTEIKNEVIEQQRLFMLSYEKLLGLLKEKHVLQTNESHLKEEEIKHISEYYESRVRPQIVPIMLSSKRPFPKLQDKGIYLAIKMTSFEKAKVKYALIQIPNTVSRFYIIPSENENGVKKLILLDDIIRFHLANIFTIFEFDKIEAYTFKITRDAELDLDDDISKSFLEKMQDSVEMRKEGDTVRFVYDASMPVDLLTYLMQVQRLEAGENIIPGGRYHNFKDFMGFPDFGIKEFVFPKAEPLSHPAFVEKNQSMLDKIVEKDIMLSYPYQRFQHVIDILREAAIDPKVTSIKINLYRVAKDSQIINALISAAKNGKRVAVVIELLARFDEKNNIKWSNYLEDNGVTVLFGVQNLKVHSKLFIIKRRVGGKSQSIAHIGTGNFHEKTAKVYTDVSLLTANPNITKEVDKVFKIFKNNFDRSVFRELMVSPFNTRRKLNSLIDQEITHAQNGEDAYIYLKINNLIDAKMIKKLYEASNAGVQIHAIVRGICGLVPGVKGLSENIEVRSVVGRYLEHSRIIIFANGGDEKYFISSADWMGRNLDRRIEVTTPIYDQDIQEELKEIVLSALKDNTKSRIIDKDQKNDRYKGQNDIPFSSQKELYKYYKAKITE